MNIVEIAAGSDDFNLLVRALTAADLVTTVQEATDITVFAPTDAAFTQLAQNLGFDGDATDEDAVFDAIVAALTDLGDGDPIPLLTDILLYHVAGGARTEPTITGSDSIATLLDGALIMPADGALGDNEPDLADPQIVIADIMADNGIIQAIDNVLLPIDIPGNTAPEDTLPTITEIVAASGTEFDADASDFDMLLAAVNAAGLAETLNDMDADLTVFAPNDGAFVALAQTLGYAAADEEGAFSFLVSALTLLNKGNDPTQLLTSILTYHVSAGAKDSTAVTATDTLDTLFGATIGVDGTTLVDNDPDIANPNLIALDISAANGIVHVIDGVLVPFDVLPSDGSDSVDFVFGSDADGTFVMGADNDFVDAGGGDDTITGQSGDDVIVGGDGTDTAVFAGDFDNYFITIGTDGVTTVTDRGSNDTGMDSLNSVEALSFADNAGFVNADTISLETLEGAASLSESDLTMLTELYVAYFDRAPDALGVLFWGNALATGTSMREIAELFFDQPETQAKLPASLATEDFVNLAYNHVLERDSDAAGLEFWTTALEDGGVSRAEFMLELIAGARANTAGADDVRTIEDKAAIGVTYALESGLTDVENARTVMDAYTRDEATDSLGTAFELIEDFANAAPGDEAIVRLGFIGLQDDPMMV